MTERRITGSAFHEHDIRTAWRAKGVTDADIDQVFLGGILRKALWTETAASTDLRAISLAGLPDKAIEVITCNLEMAAGKSLEFLQDQMRETTGCECNLTGLEILSLPPFLYLTGWSVLLAQDVYKKRNNSLEGPVAKISTLFHDQQDNLFLLVGRGIIPANEYSVVAYRCDRNHVYPREEVAAFEEKHPEFFCPSATMANLLSEVIPTKRVTPAEARHEWLLGQLRARGVGIPMSRSRGGPPGIKAELRKEALILTDLFTPATFDLAWKALPKTK